ncbi:MAG: C-GCAxxG-C-C family protein [Candidatus Heimdallarchaeota archaeon]
MTLTSILDILGLHNGIFNNMMIPLSGGLAAYKSENGWSGPCGVICGGCAAIGVIVGGREKMSSELVQLAIIKGRELPTAFEKKFGSVICTELCGYDFSEADVYLDYIRNNIWAKRCYKYALWVIDIVRDITQEELESIW